MSEQERPVQSRVWRWRRAIGESDLPPASRNILRVLSEFMDREGGSCFPSRADIVDKTGLSEKTVSKHLQIASRAGWLDIQTGIFTGQKHRRQSYLARFPNERKVGEWAHEGEGTADEAGGILTGKVGEPLPQDNTSPLTSPNISPITSPESAGARAPTRADRLRINRDFLRWLPTWPKYADFSDATARRFWFLLSDDERKACIRLTPAYLRQFGKKRSSPGDYLRDRAWEGLPAETVEIRPDKVEAKSFSPLWMVTRFFLLSQPPSGRVDFTIFDNDRIKTGQKTRDELMLEKLSVHGWPAVNQMMATMRNGQPFACPAGLEEFGGELRPVKKGSELFAAWDRLHRRRGWPFFTFTPNYVPFPAIDLGADDLDAAVETAMTRFATLISKA